MKPQGVSPVRSTIASFSTMMAAVVTLLFACSGGLFAQGAPGRVSLDTPAPEVLAGAADAGPLPSSQKLHLTLTLAPSAGRQAALDDFLGAVTNASSSSFHRWVSPAEFASRFGATAEQLASARSWVETQGLTLDAVSPSGTRMSVSGSAGQVEAAFSIALHSYQVGGQLYFANAAQPSLGGGAEDMFVAVDGLDNLPVAAGAAALARNDAAPSLPAASPLAASPLAVLAATVDANATPVLQLAPALDPAHLTAAQMAEYSLLFRQAAAQGMTVLADASSGAAAFLDLLAVRVADASAGDPAILPRPSWQAAPGLPADALRHAPDFSVSSTAELAQTLAALSTETGSRLGNVNATLYALATTPGLFDQGGRWQAATGLGVISLTRLAQVYPRGTGGSNTGISASNTAPVHGQAITFTATVAASSGGAIPTGTVTFTSPGAGFTQTSAALGATGTATSPASQLPGGTFLVTATYSGDATYAQSTATTTVTVQPEAANFTISAPSTAALGATIPLVVTLRSVSGVGTPSASVMVTPNGVAGMMPMTQTVSGSSGTASASFNFNAAQAGSLSFQASCTSSDPSFTCYTPQTATTTVSQAAPVTTLTITPATPSAGQRVSFAATVAGVTGIAPGGTVQFYDGATSLGSGGAPNATFATTLLPGSTHTLSAVYLGDNNYSKSTSNVVPLAVGTASTTTSVSSSASSATYGQNVTLSITVTPSATVNGTLPTGTLTFTGAGTTTSAAVSGGAASVVLNLPVGTYTVQTSYSGDTNYSGSTANPVTLTVTQATATLSTSLSSAAFTSNSTSTLTVTVTLPGNAQLAANTTFAATIAGVAGASYTGVFMVNAGGNTGTGSLSIPAPPAGSYTLQVACTANANFTCVPSALPISSTAMSTSGTAATTTTLTISPTTPVAGQTTTLTATIAPAVAGTGTAAVTGTVSFSDGTTVLGTAPVVASGTTYTASTTSLLSSATAHSLSAAYSGNTAYAMSTSTPVTLAAATPVAAAITLASSASTGLAGINVTLTATVTGSTAAGAAPTGMVSFYLAGAAAQLLGTASLGLAGNGVAVATLNANNLPAGAQTVYAVYAGSASFASVTSNGVTLGLTDFNVTFVPQSLTLSRGSTGQAVLILGPIGGFTGNVTFGCTPPPNTEITCSFSPVTLTGGGSTTLSIVTTAPRAQSGSRASLGLLGLVTALTLLTMLLPGCRRRLPSLLLVLLALGLTAATGCGDSSFTSTPIGSNNPGTPLGTVNVGITAAGTDGINTMRHNYSFQVTVQ